MGPRGKGFKTKKDNSRFKKFQKGNTKQKKSYSIYKTTHGDNKKRKVSGAYERHSKRQKIEDVKVQEVEIKEQSSSSDEEDDLKQLLQTFDSKVISKRTLAIDSSDESISEEETILSEQESSDLDEEDEQEAKLSEKLIMASNEKEAEIEEELVEKDEIDAEAQKEDEDKLADIHDPFAKHLFYELSESLLSSVQNTPTLVTKHSLEWPCLGKLQIQIPQGEEEKVIDSNYGIIEKKRFASPGKLPTQLKPDHCSFESLYIKSQLVKNIAAANKHVITSCKTFPLSVLQTEMFSIINSYQDLCYSHRTFDNAEEIRFVYCLHMVNHILKTRTKVLHHNAKLTKKDDVPEEFRDQGLVRPKILVVVPFRDSAYKIISTIIDILISDETENVLNKNRFIEEFTGHELAMPKRNPKPEDYEKIFTGNTGDDFRIGLTVTKKSLKLFANFYSSDIIVASPLGLRTIIGAEGEAERDFDFLASIELLILDQTEYFLMQNWDHILQLFNHLHLQPKDSHGTDFSRVRTWSLNGWAKYYRQTLIFSSVTLPEINSIFNKKCTNYAGKVKCIKNINLGSICQVFNQLPHVFQKFNASSISQSVEARFNFFVDKLLPQQREILMRQTVIYISNYFDYVKLRNYFKKEDIGFVQICEYSKEGKVARARDMFFHGDAHFMLYTERFHFFHRIRLKGIRHLIFYQPPIFPHFYYEMCNLMQEANMNKKTGSSSNMTVTVLYSQYDLNQISEIVGTERAARMLQSDRNVHMLVTDGK